MGDLKHPVKDIEKRSNSDRRGKLEILSRRSRHKLVLLGTFDVIPGGLNSVWTYDAYLMRFIVKCISKMCMYITIDQLT